MGSAKPEPKFLFLFRAVLWSNFLFDFRVEPEKIAAMQPSRWPGPRISDLDRPLLPIWIEIS